MFSILGADGKEYGPVPVEKVQEWITGGRANLETRARREGETEWRPLGTFPEFGAPPPPPPPPAPSASYPDLTIPPIPTTAPLTPAVPAIPAAAPVQRDVDAKMFAADLIARARPLDVFGCIGRSFDLWKTHLLPLVGVTALVFIAHFLAGMIPLASLVLTGVFFGGLYYYYLGKMRGEPRELGDAFAGFSKAFGPLAVCNLFLTLIVMVVSVVLIVPWIIILAMMGNGTIGNGALALVVPGMIVCALPMIYLTVAWAFGFALIIDQGLSAWTALEVSRRVITKQWFRVFFVVFLGGIIASLGFIGLFIGIFFTIPIAIGALLYAYEDLCRPPATT